MIPRNFSKNFAMGFFAKKVISYLGVDIGNASVKIVELEKSGGRPYLKNYGFAERSRRVGIGRTEEVIQASASVITKVCAEAGFVSKDAVSAFHNFDVFSSVINIPAGRNHLLAESIKIEARKFVPMQLEDVVLDWKVLTAQGALSKGADANEARAAAKPLQDKSPRMPLFDGGSKTVDVLLTAAPRRLVKKYVDIFKIASLNLLSLETESFAFIRALMDKRDDASILLLDIGAVATDIIIVERQAPIVIRSIDVGGDSITAAIAKNMRISLDRADQFKRDVGVFGANSPEDTRMITEIIESAFAPVINEIHYSIDLYKSRSRSLEKIVLSGGGSRMVGLSDFLHATFHLPVHMGNPWYKVETPKELGDTLLELGPMFTVAIGLALKEIEG